MSGYARFHRSLIGHPAFRNDAEAMAFAYMVLRASWKPTRVRYKGRGILLNRGQLSISQRDMAAALDRDKAWVERLWRRLREEDMVTVAYEAGAAVITICNYEKYQASNDAREAVGEAPDEADARQTQGTEQGIEEGKKEEGSVAKATSPARALKREAFPRPDFAEPQAWSDLLANRKRKGLANTPTAWKRMMADIERLSDDEWPPGRLIEHAAGKGWGAIYEPREGNGNSQHGKQPRSGNGFFNACVDMGRGGSG